VPVSLTPFSPRKDYLINRFPLSIHHSRHPQLTHSAIALPLCGQITAGVERCCACYHRHSEVWSRSWSDTARPTALARRSRPDSLQASSDSSQVSEHCITVSSADTRRHLRSANRHLLAARVSGSTLTAVRRFQLLARWPGTHSRILSGIQRAAQTVVGVHLKRTCSRVTSASSALGVHNDYALYKSTHSLTRCFIPGSKRTSSITLSHLNHSFPVPGLTSRISGRNRFFWTYTVLVF